jgi:LmbE family N-acetylglucosaminyl deacetylase
MENAKIVELNCTTGEVTERDMTEEEISAQEIATEQLNAQRAAEAEAAIALATLKASAKAKLVAGTPLTAEEADTLVI